MLNIRIGSGFDVHRLVNNLKLVLGGVHIPYKKGLLGHSDADVLVHSLIDALLGALALGSIGQWFPDNQEQYKDISSLELLQKVVTSKVYENYQINNVDLTIIAEKPKLNLYINDMRQKIASVLDLNLDCISIKATSTEGLGFCGRGEGIACQASVLVISK